MANLVKRTFVKWCHISVLLASLSLGLYNAAGESNHVARSLAVVYTIVALFAGVWGWWMFIVRSRMVEERSGKDFDNAFGPIVICIGLIFALCLNFGFKVGERSSCVFSYSNAQKYQIITHQSEVLALSYSTNAYTIVK